MSNMKRESSPFRKEQGLNNNCETPTTKNFETNKGSPFQQRSPTIFNNAFQFGSSLVRAPLSEKSLNTQAFRNLSDNEFSSSQKKIKISQILKEKKGELSSPSSVIQKTGFSQLLNKGSNTTNSQNKRSQVKASQDENNKPRGSPKHPQPDLTTPTLGDLDYEYRPKKNNGTTTTSSTRKENSGCNFIKSPKSGGGTLFQVGQSCKPLVSKFNFFSCSGKDAVKDSLLEAPRDTHEILNTSEYAKGSLGRLITGIEHVTIEEFDGGINIGEKDFKKAPPNVNRVDEAGSPRGLILVSDELDTNSNYSKSILSSNGNCTISNISALGKKKIFDKSFQSGLGDIGELKEIMDYLMVKANSTNQIPSINMTSDESRSGHTKNTIGLMRTSSAANLIEKNERFEERRNSKPIQKRSVSPIETVLHGSRKDPAFNKDIVTPKRPLEISNVKSPKKEEISHTFKREASPKIFQQENITHQYKSNGFVNLVMPQPKSVEKSVLKVNETRLTDSSNFSLETMEIGDNSELKLNVPPEFKTNLHFNKTDVPNMLKSSDVGGKQISKERLETPAKKGDPKYFSDGKRHNPLNTDRSCSGSGVVPLHMNSTPKFTRNLLNTNEKHLFQDLNDVSETHSEQRRLFESEEYEKIERGSSKKRSATNAEILASPSNAYFNQGAITEYYNKFTRPLFSKKQNPVVHEIETFYESQPSLKEESNACDIEQLNSPIIQKGLRDSKNSSRLVHSLSRFHSCDFSSVALLSQIQNENEPRRQDVERPFYPQRAKINEEKPATSNTSFASTGNSQLVFLLNNSTVMSKVPQSGRSDFLDNFGTNRHHSTRSSQSLSGFSLTPFESKEKEDMEYLRNKYLNETSLYKLSIESGNNVKVACFTPKDDKEKGTEQLNSERVAMVFCQDCKEYVDLRQSLAHSKRCGNRRLEENLNKEDSINEVNERLKGMMNLMLERVKRFDNIDKDIVNTVLMLASCMELIIGNNENCDVLFEFLVDSNMLNKRLSEKNSKLAHGMLGISHRVPELTKQKINSIRKMEDKSRLDLQQNKDLKSESMEQKKKKFFELATSIRRQLPQSHKSNNLLIAEIFAEAIKRGLPEMEWAGFLCSKYFQAGGN